MINPVQVASDSIPVVQFGTQNSAELASPVWPAVACVKWTRELVAGREEQPMWRRFVFWETSG